ncbi:MAG: response regulator transcription factor [Bacteroidetes bacterium]|nr:response regulator transcription factor [Bacteroidota bacterium]
MLKAILIDDETSCTEVLRWQIETYCPTISILCECHQPEEAIEKIRDLHPDVIFLDIEMPGMNAFEMLNILKPFEFEVIFTTAYNQFAVHAFKENAIDYLLKPIEKSDLIHAVEKLKNKDNKYSNEKIEILLNLFKEQLKSNKKIALPTQDGISFINVDQIVRVESDSNYSFVHLVTGENICITKTLKQIESSLEAQPFYRVHQSHLVNLNHIEKFVKDGGGYLVMSDKSTITVARQRKDGFMELFSRL